MVKRLPANRHQFIPGDLSEYPRPGEHEIFRESIYARHLERAKSSCGADIHGGGEDGAVS